jgi:hypothetical protein
VQLLTDGGEFTSPKQALKIIFLLRFAVRNRFADRLNAPAGTHPAKLPQAKHAKRSRGKQ